MSTDAPRPSADYELTPEDWEEVNAVHVFENPIYKEQVKNLRVLGSLIFVVLGLLSFLLGYVPGAFLCGIAALIAPVLAGPLQQKAQRQALKKMTEQGISHGTFGPHHVEVRPEGFYHKSSAYQALYRWHAIDEVKERDGWFFVYMGANAFLPIPAEAFPDAASLRDFADDFYARVQDAKEGDAGQLSEGAWQALGAGHGGGGKEG